MKNVDNLYKNYYDAYKSHYDTDNELNEDKKKKFDYKQFELDNEINKESKLDEKTGILMLLRWINVSEKKFNEILSTVTEAKNNGLKINVDRREITLDKTESLLKGIDSGKINGHEFKEKYNDIIDNVKKTLNKPMLTRSQKNMVEILLLLKEIPKSKYK